MSLKARIIPTGVGKKSTGSGLYTWPEVWSRWYSQYAATSSGSRRAMKELEAKRKRFPDDLYFDDGDVEALQKVTDRLLFKIGFKKVTTKPTVAKGEILDVANASIEQIMAHQQCSRFAAQNMKAVAIARKKNPERMIN